VPNVLGEMRVVEEVEEWMAFYQLYEGAAYMNSGRTYIVHSLDFEKRVAVARGPVSVDYYTSVRDLTDIQTSAPLLAYPPLPQVSSSSIKHPHKTLQPGLPRRETHRGGVGGEAAGPGGGGAAASVAAAPKYGLVAAPKYGPALVTKSFIGYNKFQRMSGKLIDTIDLQMPQVMLKTFATWVPVPEDVQALIKEAARTWEVPGGLSMGWEEHLRGGLHAASHALINVLPLFAKSSPTDALTICDYPAARRFRPRFLLIADRCKGGNGLSLEAFRVFRELVVCAIELIAGCECAAFRGCPSCVQMMSCAQYNVVLDKRAALTLLRGMLGVLAAPTPPECDIPQTTADSYMHAACAGCEQEAGGMVKGEERKMDVNSLVLRKQRTLF
jgi:DEAD/DEAH box helicase domain-containing protein